MNAIISMAELTTGQRDRQFELKYDAIIEAETNPWQLCTRPASPPAAAAAAASEADFASSVGASVFLHKNNHGTS